MSFLVILRPARDEMPFDPTEDESRIVREHYEYLVQLRDAGKLVVAGPTIEPGDTFGIGVDGDDERGDPPDADCGAMSRESLLSFAAAKSFSWFGVASTTAATGTSPAAAWNAASGSSSPA